MLRLRSFDRGSTRGVALVIVLAFIVLVTGLVVAYLSRATADRQITQSSFNDSAADILARSALQIVVSNLKQEITNAGTVSATNVEPTPYGTPSAGQSRIPNLIGRSFSGDPTGLTSNVNSTAVSTNGRSINPARWNSHYLIPRASTTTSVDSTPISSFTPPDWVLLSSQGPQILTPPASTAIGRYAYAVYNEGGLLDLNIAFFPFWPTTPAASVAPGVPVKDVGGKGTVALADLTALPTSPTVITASTSTPSSWASASSANDIVGWRNYASVQPTGSFSNFVFDLGTASAPSTGSRFLDVFLNPSASFLNVSTTTNAGRTDQAFMTRGELLAFRSSTGFSQSVLQYLGSFSRELNKPTWSDSGTRLAGRFPLSRFNAFAITPPNTADAAAIQQNFGLQYVAANASASPPTAEHWQYVGTSGTTLLTTIPSIAGNNQSPDLFPLLQYALAPGTSTAEILSIGASFIDQRDTNDDTTWIEFGTAAAPQKAFGVDRNASTDPSAPPQPPNVVVLNRAFRNVGELGYAYRNASTTLDFLTASSTDASLLDLFTFNTATTRAGTIDLNTANIAVITSLLTGAATNEAAPTFASRTNSYHTAQNIFTESNQQHAIGRAEVSRLAGAAGTFFGVGDEAQKAVVRALAEVTQTRTWNLMIDVIAQSGRYPPNTTNLSQFIVEGEKRYWLHIAIDRFTGQVIDQQLEPVYQ